MTAGISVSVNPTCLLYRLTGTAHLTLPQSRPTAIPTSEGRVRWEYFLKEGFPCSHILKHKGRVSQVIKHT